MKRKNLFLLALASSLLLVACNSGSSLSSPVPTPTPSPAPAYQLGDVFISAFTTCQDVYDPLSITQTYICPANESVVINFKTISYTSSPASYVVIPAASTLPSGVVIDGTCSTVAATNYVCNNIKVSSTGSADGTTVAIPVSGSAGIQNFINIMYTNK